MRRIVLLAVLQCMALAALTAPAVVGLSVMVGRMVLEDQAPHALATVISAGGIAAMIANPSFGYLVDRFGYRRRWLGFGALAGLLTSCLLPMATTAGFLAVAWALTQVAYNSCFGAINSLVSAGLAPAERTRAAGFFSAASFIGTLPGLAMAGLFPANTVMLSIGVPIITLFVVVGVLRFVPDSDRVIDESPPRRWDGVREVLSASFLVVLVCRLVISIELTAGLVFSLYLFQERWGLDETAAARLVSVSTLIGSVGIVVISLLIATSALRRVDARGLLAVFLGLLIVAMLARGLTESVGWFIVATALAGLSIGGGMTATRSLAHVVLPPQRSALGLGLLGVANSLGGVVGAPLAGVLLKWGSNFALVDNYAGMYVLLAALVLIVGLLVPLAPRPPRDVIDATN